MVFYSSPWGGGVISKHLGRVFKRRRRGREGKKEKGISNI